jgi:hypothetical protein
MNLRLFGHLVGLSKRRHQPAHTRDELSGITDAVTTLIIVPPLRHTLTLQRVLTTGSVPVGAIAGTPKTMVGLLLDLTGALRS